MIINYLSNSCHLYLIMISFQFSENYCAEYCVDTQFNRETMSSLICLSVRRPMTVVMMTELGDTTNQFIQGVPEKTSS